LVQNDLIDVTKQALSDIALVLHQNIVQAYQEKNLNQLIANSNQMLFVIEDMDSILASQKDYMLSLWINRARALGTTRREKDLYELNARTQVTLWGRNTSGLHEYAYKLWSGLVGSFYKYRWSLFIVKLEADLVGGPKFNITQFEDESIAFEEV